MDDFRFSFLDNTSKDSSSVHFHHENLSSCGILSEVELESALSVMANRNKSLVFGSGDVALYQSNEVDSSLQQVKTSIYEGGNQLWECTFDLIHYLNAVIETLPSLQYNIVDIGCGTGFLGIYLSLKLYYSRLILQDFNKEVLTSTTIFNVAVNHNSDILKKTSLIYGDWNSLAKNIELFSSVKNKSPNIIVASEILYNIDLYESLISIFKSLLAEPESVLFIASKRYYFGVGGGSTSFMSLINSNHPRLICKVVTSYEDGSSNVRDVIRCQLQPDISNAN